MPNLKQLVMLASLFAVSAVFPAASAELATQKSSERGVTVAVTPQELFSNARTWDFKIALDTHSEDLSDDLLKTAVLLDGTGTQHVPVAWDGTAPGGHHCEGVLRFKASDTATGGDRAEDRPPRRAGSALVPLAAQVTVSRRSNA